MQSYQKDADEAVIHHYKQLDDEVGQAAHRVMCANFALSTNVTLFQDQPSWEKYYSLKKEDLAPQFTTLQMNELYTP